MAMLRLARRTRARARPPRGVGPHPGDLIYAEELRAQPDVTIVHSRSTGDGTGRPAGRLTAGDLAPLVRADATTYVCGGGPFADAASDLLLAVGVDAATIRIERFGPTG